MKRSFMLKSGFGLMLSAALLAGCGENENEMNEETANAGGGTKANNENNQDNNQDNNTDAQENNNANEDNADGDIDRSDWPEEFIYGILPAEDADELSNRYEPFQEFLEEHLDMPVTLYQGTDYTAMIEAMRNGHIHAAKFGGFAYTLASERAGAEAFAQGVNDADNPTYQAYFITRESTGIESLDDLDGTNFAFVDPASASGHLFPRAKMISDLGLENDDIEGMFNSMVFAGNHDSAFLSVLNGDVDAGAISDSTWINSEGEYDDHPNMEEMFVFDKTDPIPRSPEAYHDELPESFKEELQRIFLAMNDEESLEQFMLDHRYDDGFVAIEDDNYDVVRETADALGMSPEELLN